MPPSLLEFSWYFLDQGMPGHVARFFLNHKNFFKKLLTNPKIWCIIRVQKERRIKEMTRERMLDDFCKWFGLEDERTIVFASMCEDPAITDEFLENVYMNLAK